MYSRTAEATLRLPEAPHLPSSRLVELMELAAARLMRPRLAAGQSSIAIATQLNACAQTVGGELRAVATARGVNGRLHHFEVNVFDSGGLVASCEHTRAVVVGRRLEAMARRRAGRHSMLLEV
jgi:predicted thioesterase